MKGQMKIAIFYLWNKEIFSDKSKQKKMRRMLNIGILTRRLNELKSYSWQNNYSAMDLLKM